MAVCHVLCLFYLFLIHTFVIYHCTSLPLVGGLGFGIGQALECFHFNTCKSNLH